MQAYVDWVLKSFGTQVIKKKQPVRPVFPDYLSVSYDYGFYEHVYMRPEMNSNRFEISLWDKISLWCEVTSLSAFT